MTNRAVISSPDAPQAIGPYSQAVKVGNTVWLSGQIPLDPSTMTLVQGDISEQAHRVFSNLAAVAQGTITPESAAARILPRFELAPADAQEAQDAA